MAASWRESRRADPPRRNRRPIRVWQLRRHLLSTGTVASGWRRSCGCCRIMICVLVENGSAGIESHRHTVAGLSQTLQILRRAFGWLNWLSSCIKSDIIRSKHGLQFSVYLLCEEIVARSNCSNFLSSPIIHHFIIPNQKSTLHKSSIIKEIYIIYTTNKFYTKLYNYT